MSSIFNNSCGINVHPGLTSTRCCAGHRIAGLAGARKPFGCCRDGEMECWSGGGMRRWAGTPGAEAVALRGGRRGASSFLSPWSRVRPEHPHELPQRPLRKLVPEGPQSAKPSHFDVLAEIVTGLGRDETDKQLADRICMLMGASDEH